MGTASRCCRSVARGVGAAVGAGVGAVVGAGVGRDVGARVGACVCELAQPQCTAPSISTRSTAAAESVRPSR